MDFWYLSFLQKQLGISSDNFLGGIRKTIGEMRLSESACTSAQEKEETSNKPTRRAQRSNPQLLQDLAQSLVLDISSCLEYLKS